MASEWPANPGQTNPFIQGNLILSSLSVRSFTFRVGTTLTRNKVDQRIPYRQYVTMVYRVYDAFRQESPYSEYYPYGLPNQQTIQYSYSVAGKTIPLEKTKIIAPILRTIISVPLPASNGKLYFYRLPGQEVPYGDGNYQIGDF